MDQLKRDIDGYKMKLQAIERSMELRKSHVERLVGMFTEMQVQLKEDKEHINKLEEEGMIQYMQEDAVGQDTSEDVMTTARED
jgi:hypothetical protein